MISMKAISVVIILMVFSLSVQALTFSQAKRELKGLYLKFPKSFYCECEIDWVSKNKLVPLHQSCGYQNRKNTQLKRANRIEFEHVVPAWEFGHQRQCWQKGKRKYCAKNDETFRQMEGDVHNLVPAVGEVNGDRSSFRYGMIEGEERAYGKCDAEVNFKNRVFEPAPRVRGDVARIYMYFAKTYGLRISKKQRRLFSAWSKMDPVDGRECALEREKAKIQGNNNPYVRRDCVK